MLPDMNSRNPRDEDNSEPTNGVGRTDGDGAPTPETQRPVHGARWEGEMHYVTDIDERWVTEWVAFGLSEMETYLRKYARFEAYCERRPLVRGKRANG